jgi:hypothetical protein
MRAWGKGKLRCKRDDVGIQRLPATLDAKEGVCLYSPKLPETAPTNEIGQH